MHPDECCDCDYCTGDLFPCDFPGLCCTKALDREIESDESETWLTRVSPF